DLQNTIKDYRRAGEEQETTEKDIAAADKALKEIKERHKEIANKMQDMISEQNKQREMMERYSLIIEKIDSKINAAENRGRISENSLIKERTNLEHLEQKIADFGFENFLELSKGVVVIPRDIHDQLGYFGGELRSLGDINRGSIDMYKRALKERKEFAGRVEDLNAARENLNTLIGLIKEKMESEYLFYFKKIQEQFKNVYTSLFGGGSAELVMSRQGTPLEADIDIVVSPPGKRTQALSLLSGGEKALTALALLFAILKEKESPLCILDEVDTSLDEVNVRRFTKYLNKCSRSTQFIVVTHRQYTMENADTLYGVTMPEEGVSKVVSVKLQTAL
ncbi:MAG: AAA family ATPase, partial [Clostridia bacterium]|nr:AAA family ATPase [Clostridia bacterium]